MSGSVLRGARVRVPGSTSNLGAGFDCIGLALDRHLDAWWTPGPGPMRVERDGTLTGLPADGADLLSQAFLDGLAEHGVAPPGGVLCATSAIPLARGLGSSAAAVVAGLALAAAVVDQALDRDAALAAAVAIEGHPDNAAPALLGGLVGVARDSTGAATAFPLPLSTRIDFAWAAPVTEVSTARARAALPADVPHAQAVRSLSRLAALLRGLETADPSLLRIGFEDELHVPFRLPLIPRAGAAFEAARSAGAWAVTISGSGSGLIAACPPGAAGAVASAMDGVFSAEGIGSVAFAASPDRTGARVIEVLT
jgi:homoserine kinase